MDFLGILLIIIWLVASAVGAADKRRKRQAPRPLPPNRPSARPSAPATEKPRSVIDRFRAELEKLQEQAAAAERARVSSRPPLPEIELEPDEWEERDTLEIEPEVRSLEVPVPARLRVLVDQDDLAEAIVRRRIQEAEARNQALTPADHRAFDQAIRTPRRRVAAAGTGRRRVPLRDAIVWREVLGPPKALQ